MLPFIVNKFDHIYTIVHACVCVQILLLQTICHTDCDNPILYIYFFKGTVLQETQANGKELSWLKWILLNYSFIRHLEWHEHLSEIKIGVNRAHRLISSSFLQQVSCLFSFFFSVHSLRVCNVPDSFSLPSLSYTASALTYGHVGKAEKMFNNVSNNRVNMDSIKKCGSVEVLYECFKWNKNGVSVCRRPCLYKPDPVTHLHRTVSQTSSAADSLTLTWTVVHLHSLFLHHSVFCFCERWEDKTDEQKHLCHQ